MNKILVVVLVLVFCFYGREIIAEMFKSWLGIVLIMAFLGMKREA